MGEIANSTLPSGVTDKFLIEVVVFSAVGLSALLCLLLGTVIVALFCMYCMYDCCGWCESCERRRDRLEVEQRRREFNMLSEDESDENWK